MRGADQQKRRALGGQLRALPLILVLIRRTPNLIRPTVLVAAGAPKARHLVQALVAHEDPVAVARDAIGHLEERLDPPVADGHAAKAA